MAQKSLTTGRVVELHPASALQQRRFDLFAVQQQVRELLEQRYVETPAASVLVVVPEVTSPRSPWIEIRMVRPADDQTDLELHIESSWPDVDFEIVWVDEEGL